MNATLGVCSWSLRPADAGQLAEAVAAAGLSAVQLALDPLRSGAWQEIACTRALADAGIQIRSGMMATRGEDYSTLESIRRTGGIVPDEHWDANWLAAAENAQLARRLGLKLVTLHAGFIPESPGAERDTILDRLRAVAELFASEGVALGLETGQETAETLCDALAALDHPNVGVNFDPANMILYGMGEPVAALRRLAPYVRQIHIKDATPAATPGTWGTEVVAGTGAVDWPAFFDALREARIDCDLMIEREAGESRVEDIRTAAELVRSLHAAPE